MKKLDRSRIAYDRSKSDKLSLRSQTLRILTERELTLVMAGNCVNGSIYSQGSTANLIGGC